MTTPSGLPRRALAFFPSARGAAAQRMSTADFYQALRDAGATFGNAPGGLSFQDVNQLRGAATGLRNAAERLARAPESNAIDATMIGVTPYARGLAEQATMPLYHVGVTLNTITNEGDEQSRYTVVQFTGQLPPTKGELFAAVQRDAQALADAYEEQYAGHSVVEILAV